MMYSLLLQLETHSWIMNWGEKRSSLLKDCYNHLTTYFTDPKEIYAYEIENCENCLLR